ncbi:putative histone deacetylase complex subunit cti6 like protein [Verticillium longisporum]|nr:putative histone deacetylase complex subunit cti6 like protein [Verticillium longisporum]
MAPPSPRRSSRARGNTLTQSTQSSSASSLSSRAERNTRSLIKTSSNKSTPTSASLSSEPLDEPEDSILPRRRTRAQEEIRDKIQVDPYEMANDGDDIQEDDESVRCICGFDEYPGPPPFDDDVKSGKENPEADFFASIELSDEVSGLFVQCDICKVWQHGACVGIFTEESSPDEYFCEKCRKDLHKIHIASNSQRYSNYLPLGRQSRSSSRATSVAKDGTRSPKDSSARSARASSAAQAAKRRSTMNSRDAGYDEDEQLRRAIEASKEEAPDGQPSDLVPRRLKRGRSNSQDNQLSLKRQRTSSPSMSPPPESNFAIEDNSEDDSTGRNGTSKKLRVLGHPKERTEREERDRQRLESANKRKGRADRRRADGIGAPTLPTEREGHSTAESEPAEDTAAVLAPARPVVKPNVEPPPPPPVEPTPSAAPTPDPTPAPPAPTGSTHKKSSRSHQKRAKGRNQYTKDRDDPEASPVRSMSRDTVRQEEAAIGGGTTKVSGVDSGRHTARSKAHLHSKASLPDMKRRVAAFLDFISKTQIEMAGESSSGSGSSQNNSEQHSPRDAVPGATETHANGVSTTESKVAHHANGDLAAPAGGQDFKELSCVEMMDVLTRDLVKWQNQYAN